MCKELINFDSLNTMYGKELLGFDIFDQETAHGKKTWIELKNRVIEHVSQLIYSVISCVLLMFPYLFCRIFELFQITIHELILVA